MTELTGRTLGKYRLHERLGRGGMAEVYKAYQPGLDRFVAIKILHPHLADAPDFRGRFQREARAVAQLHHPHIVQVFDFDVEGDQHYMVMEYIQGTTLKALLDDHYARGERLPLQEVFGIFRALLQAVAYAHDHGMVHRDLKPANVMLDRGGRPVLTDFGIAKIVGGAQYTASGVSVGTPAYMSPEQGQGESGDARSDIYSLGIMLYECLAGHAPYEAESSVAVLLKHIRAPIPSLRQTRPDLPDALDKIIAAALAKNPDERYPSAREMWAALAGLVLASEAPTAIQNAAGVKSSEHPSVPLEELAADAGPAATSRRSFEPRPMQRASRTMVLAGASLGVLLLILAGVFIAPRLAGTSPADKAIAEGQARLAEGDYQLAADAFTSALQLDPQDVRAFLGRAQAYEQLGQVTDALADVERAVSLAPDRPAGYEERARLNVQYGLGAEPAEVLADLDQAVKLARPPDSAHAYFLRGWAILNFPLVDGAPNPRAALADLRQSISLDPKQAEAQFTLAQALLAAKQPGEALTAANRAVELDPQGVPSRKLRGHIQFALGDLHAAMDDLTAGIGLETEGVALATLYAERAYLNFRLKASLAANADLDKALSLAPESRLAGFVRMLLDPSLVRPDAAGVEAARADAPDDPIWQAVLDELSSPP